MDADDADRRGPWEVSISSFPPRPAAGRTGKSGSSSVGPGSSSACGPTSRGPESCIRAPGAILTASSTAFSFITGSTPGMPRHTGQTIEFGRASYSTSHPQNIFVRVARCMCTSRPMVGLKVGARSWPPSRPAAAPAWPNRLSLEHPRDPKELSSVNTPVRIWRPTGRPAVVRPHGRLRPAMPARFAAHGVDVRQVHGQRVGGLLADLKAAVGAGRPHDAIDVLRTPRRNRRGSAAAPSGPSCSRRRSSPRSGRSCRA